jgi:hypothetical protein
MVSSVHEKLLVSVLGTAVQTAINKLDSIVFLVSLLEVREPG